MSSRLADQYGSVTETERRVFIVACEALYGGGRAEETCRLGVR